jgi:hypothetical protein
MSPVLLKVDENFHEQDTTKGSDTSSRRAEAEGVEYCQLGVVGVRLGRFVADLRIHQAHVTSCQTRKERDRKRRWLTDRSRWRPTRKRFWMPPCTNQNRCA